MGDNDEFERADEQLCNAFGSLTGEIFHIVIEKFGLFGGNILFDPLGDGVFVFRCFCYFVLSTAWPCVFLCDDLIVNQNV